MIELVKQILKPLFLFGGGFKRVYKVLESASAGLRYARRQKQRTLIAGVIQTFPDFHSGITSFLDYIYIISCKHDFVKRFFNFLAIF